MPATIRAPPGCCPAPSAERVLQGAASGGRDAALRGTPVHRAPRERPPGVGMRLSAALRCIALPESGPRVPGCSSPRRGEHDQAPAHPARSGPREQGYSRIGVEHRGQGLVIHAAPGTGVQPHRAFRAAPTRRAVSGYRGAAWTGPDHRVRPSRTSRLDDGRCGGIQAPAHGGGPQDDPETPSFRLTSGGITPSGSCLMGQDWG